MQNSEKRPPFEQAVLPHMDAAYNLARWLTRNDHDAEDVVQEATYRALKYFSAFRGENSRAWLLTIVRNTCYSWLRQNRSRDIVPLPDENPPVETDVSLFQSMVQTMNPEALLLSRGDQEMFQKALEALPAEFREVMILREMEEMSYKEIAGICNLPMGTVMSRLARGRKLLQRCLEEWNKEGRQT